jgi:hypothetical protein
VQGNVVRFIALDFVLRIVRSRVMSISFVFDVFQMHSYDCSSNVPGLRVPGDVARVDICDKLPIFMVC